MTDEGQIFKENLIKTKKREGSSNKYAKIWIKDWHKCWEISDIYKLDPGQTIKLF
jgi:hypothetical protein